VFALYSFAIFRQYGLTQLSVSGTTCDGGMSELSCRVKNAAAAAIVGTC